jgi:hypothetical protein
MKAKDSPQLDLMRYGVEYSFPISCRRLTVQVRPLTNLEIIQATSMAAEAFQKLPPMQQISVTSSLLSAMHQLEKASAPDINETPTLPMSVMQMMTPEEINHLWKQYVRVTDVVNPSFEFMSTDEFNKLVDDLKKSSDQLSQLTDLSISNLIGLARHLLALTDVLPPAK